MLLPPHFRSLFGALFHNVDKGERVLADLLILDAIEELLNALPRVGLVLFSANCGSSTRLRSQLSTILELAQVFPPIGNFNQ